MDQTARPKILQVATLWWPLSARLATRFIHYGAEVSAVCPPGHVLHHVVGMRRLYDHLALRPGAALAEAIEAARPDIVIPCDDRAVWQLHELHAQRADLRQLIERSLGPAAGYPVVGARLRLLELAQSLGIRVPETRQVRSQDDLHSWFAEGPRPSVMKADATWGGDGVQMVDTERQALAAYAELRITGDVATALKRLLINRDPLARWTLRRQQNASFSLQKRIVGRPANAMVACWHGEVLDIVAVDVLSSQGPTGAAIVVRLMDNREVVRAARALIESLRMTGFCGLDFVIETSTGIPYLIELNPRSTQLGHLAVSSKGDLAAAFYERISGTPIRERPARIENDLVAFFPQSLVAQPASRFAAQAHLDVPSEHPTLVRELLRPPFPDRAWLSRLYHRYRTVQSPATVDHEVPDWEDRISTATTEKTG